MLSVKEAYFAACGFSRLSNGVLEPILWAFKNVICLTYSVDAGFILTLQTRKHALTPRILY